MVINLASSDLIRDGGAAWSNTVGNNIAQTYNIGNVVGDSVIANFYAPSGHYDIGFHFDRNADGAIIDVNLDGVVIATYDLYAAAGASYQPVLNDIVLVDGDHYISFTVTGANGASSGHHAYLGFVSIKSR